MIVSLLIFFMGCANESTAPEVLAEPSKEVVPTPAPPVEKPEPVVETIEVPEILLHPEQATEEAPNTFTVLFTTTKGDFLVEVDKSWAPQGVNRFYNLVNIGYFENVAFFRAIKGFMVQFGLHGAPEVNTVWREAQISDDAANQSNTRGMLTFATAGANTRTSQLFINLEDNSSLDSQGFTPFAKVVDEEGRGGGMSVVDSLFTGYGEGAPRGRGPNQQLIHQRGNAYLKLNFPELDYLISVRVCGATETAPEGAPAYCQ
jgi:peptidyl-prolyl cis-trans isomerase A (cyclophilin A)